MLWRKTNEDNFSFLHITNSRRRYRIRNQQQNFIWTTWFLLIICNTPLTSSFCPPSCSCNDVTLAVDCHQETGNLDMVPIFLNPQTKFLSLAKNQISEIAMSFQFYSELQFLDFSENKIENIGQNNFENLKNLRVLNASYNSIKELYEDVFLGLGQLQVLDLSVNQIEKVERKVLAQLRNLKELTLDRNRLDSLDWDVFQGLEKLEKLSAKFNFLRVIQPPTSMMMNQIPSIVLQQQQEKGGESSILNSNSNSRTKLLPSSPSWSLKNVIELDLSWNQLTRVKNHGLAIFSSLKSINLCCNYIHTVEEKAFIPFPAGQLIHVNLSQNRLGKIPIDSLEGLESLIELDLSSNGISDTIPSHAFRNLLKLQRLRLSDNPGIISIDPDALIDNINLIVFEGDYLSNLTEFEVGLFNNKPYLEKFSLQFSRISSLPTELFQSPQYTSLVSTLSLLGNPLDCNCSSFPLFQWIAQQQSSTMSSAFQKQGASSSSSNNIHKYQTNNNNNNASRILNENNNKNNMSTTTSSHAMFNEQPLVQLSLHQSQQKKQQNLKSPYHKISSSTLSSSSSSFQLQLVCVTPEKLHGIYMKDLSQTDFEHCFDQFPFSSEHFEILVIIIASVVIFLIITVVIIRLCCIYQICTKCTQKLKSRSRSRKRKESSAGGNNVSNNGASNNGNNNPGGGGGILIGVDEFCSNLLNNKPSQVNMQVDYPIVLGGTAVSPQLVTKINKKTTNKNLNNYSSGGAVILNGGIENNGLQLSLLNNTLMMNSANKSRFANGLSNNSCNSMLRNGHSLSTMTTGLSSSSSPPEYATATADNTYSNDEGENVVDEDEDEDEDEEEEDDDEEGDYNNPYQSHSHSQHHHHHQQHQKFQQYHRPPPPPAPPFYPPSSTTTMYTSSNNKLRFDPKIQLQLPYSTIAAVDDGKRTAKHNDKKSQNQNLQQHYQQRSHQIHSSSSSPYHHRPHHPSQPPPQKPPPGIPIQQQQSMMLQYEYDYPEFPITGTGTMNKSNNGTSKSNLQQQHHNSLSHHHPHSQHQLQQHHQSPRIKQVPSVLV